MLKLSIGDGHYSTCIMLNALRNYAVSIAVVVGLLWGVSAIYIYIVYGVLYIVYCMHCSVSSSTWNYCVIRFVYSSYCKGF